MCLILNKRYPFPKRAKEDIICYKSLITDEHTVITPFQGFPVCNYSDLVSSKRLEMIPREGVIKSIIENISESVFSLELRVSIGLIHSYKKPRHCFYVNEAGIYREVIVECVIPKDTWYFEGIYPGLGDNLPSYASRKLVVLEVVDSKCKEIYEKKSKI